MQLGTGRCRWALRSPRACLLGLLQGPGAAKLIVAAVHDRWVVASGGKIMLGRTAEAALCCQTKLFSYLAIYDLAAEHFATKSVQYGQGDTNKMYH